MGGLFVIYFLLLHYYQLTGGDGATAIRQLIDEGAGSNVASAPVIGSFAGTFLSSQLSGLDAAESPEGG